jgi:hypothetical protein
VPDVEAGRSQPHRTSIGAFFEYEPEPDVLPAVGAHALRFFKCEVITTPIKEKRTDRGVDVWPVEYDAAHDFQTGLQCSGLRGMTAGEVKARPRGCLSN